MKLKGKATFELTNVETGETRVVKEENMVTNAYEEVVNGTGPYSNFFYWLGSVKSTGLSGIDRGSNNTMRFSAGLVLFNGQLQEDPNHIYLTADDPDVVGVAADLAYTGNQTCAGSYNVTESGRLENGYKYVWDFTTHQANGDIGCACLTSIEGASLGFGLPTYDSSWYGNMFNLSTQYPKYSPLFTDAMGGFRAGNYGYFDEGRNLFIRPKYFSFCRPGSGSTATETPTDVTNESGNYYSQKVFDRTIFYRKAIDFEVYRCPFTNWSILDRTSYSTVNFSNTPYFNGNGKLIDIVTVEMPPELVAVIPNDIVQTSVTTQTFWPTAVNYDEGFMYISFIIPKGTGTLASMHTVLPGEKIYTWKINMTTFESTWFSITNTTGNSIAVPYSADPYSAPFVVVCNDYTVLCSAPETYYFRGNMYIIDNATGSTIKQVVDSEGSPANVIMTRPLVVNNILYGGYHGSVRFNVVNLKTGINKYLSVNDVGMFQPAGISSSTQTCVGRTFGTKAPKLYTRYSDYSGNNRAYSSNNFYFNPMYLLTINNLENTVTKTSAETMKVTYILTESEE